MLQAHAIKEIRKTSGYFESFDETPVYYEVRGEGKPLVLMYGIACGMNHWHHQIKHFSQKYKVITFDYRGHQKTPSPKNRENLSVDALAKDFLALCDHLNLEEVSVWGHSFGTPVVLRAFEMRPNIVANLVLVNGFATNPIKKMFGNDFAGNTFKIVKKGHELMPETVNFLWREVVNHPVTQHLSALAGGFNLKLTSIKDIEVYSRGVGAMNLGDFTELFDRMMTFDGRPVLPQINVPTIIFGGTKDTVTPAFHQYELNKKIKGSQLVMIPYGSHCTQLDMPDFLNLKIEKFLQQNSY